VRGRPGGRPRRLAGFGASVFSSVMEVLGYKKIIKGRPCRDEEPGHCAGWR
jgi:hypothetical protein